MIVDLRIGDCRDVLRTLEPESVDAVITDPPYGLSFMGKDWDHGIPGLEFWRAVWRVAKPGAYVMAFGGTRTFHRLACAIEDADFELRDVVLWLYSVGFPKSHNVSKALDREAGAEREQVRIDGRDVRNPKAHGAGRDGTPGATSPYIERGMREGFHMISGDTPVTPEASEWQGWGTALKPCWEPIIMARKPPRGTVAQNVLAYRTGAINIDALRIPIPPDDPIREGEWTVGASRIGLGGKSESGFVSSNAIGDVRSKMSSELGRWPGNVLHDGALDFSIVGASRYFYCAKTTAEDRNDGCGDLPERYAAQISIGANPHPTVKPTALMSWLCRMVATPMTTILDPFCGSGSTGRGAVSAGAKRFIGIDLDPEYIAIAQRRIDAAHTPLDRLLGEEEE